MRIKLFKKNKKGVSSVLGAVIMTLIVVIGMSAALAFFVNYAGNFQRGRGSAVLESIVIESHYFEVPDKVTLWVGDVGKVDFDVTDVYINDARAEIIEYMFEENNLYKLVVEADSNLIAEGRYRFKLITARGSVLEETLSLAGA
jgi:flagellin-like protein